MSAVGVGAVRFGCVFASAIFGMGLGARLPEHHVRAESKEVVKLGVGLLATMAALILSLLIASAKNAYDAKNTQLQELAANVVLLDRVLAHYGPETTAIRTGIRKVVETRLQQIWPDRGSGIAVNLAQTTPVVEGVQDAIAALTPRDDAQRASQARAIQVSGDMAQMRWLVFERTGSAIPTAFLVVLVFWVSVIFGSFGLFAPRNATVIGVLFICAVSVAAAIFLILELDTPLDGMLKISSEPLRYALENLGK